MKPQDLTTEHTEKKNFRFSKSSVNSVVASSPEEYPLSKRSNGTNNIVRHGSAFNIEGLKINFKDE